MFPSHSLGMAFVFLDHPLGLLRLMLVVGILGFLVFALALFLLLLHLSFSFADGSRRLLRGA